MPHGIARWYPPDLAKEVVTQTAPDMSTSRVLIRQTSPGRMPVRSWSWIIAPTWRDTWGRIASTSTAGTGRTGGLSRASGRPLPRPWTAWRS
jgi:hypothetical protein